MRRAGGKRRLRLQRLEVVALLCILPLALIVPRLAWLQLVQGGRLDATAENQRIRRVWIPPLRGEVRDRNGERLAYSVLDTTGRREMRRVYPYGSRASQVLGYVDWKDEGAAGIELAFEAELKGHPGWETQVRSGKLADRYVLPASRRRANVAGADITLTLDAALQDIAASALEDAVRELRAKSGVVVAVDPRTGDVLAMAGYPSFNPYAVGGAQKESLRMRAVTDAVEPGSTAKLLTALAALRDGIVHPQTRIHCENGRYTIGARVIEDHEPFGILSFKDCFAKSSNIAFAKVGMECGVDRLYDTARLLGFGSPTGICLDGESRGILRPKESWNPRYAPASVSIGYEIGVTPLQLTMAYAAIANNGVLMRPRLLRGIETSRGEPVFEARPLAVGRVVEPSLARILLDFMAETVQEGTGKQAGLDWAVVGGKTGTARLIVGDGYSKEHHRASFVGIAPLDDPRIVLTVMIEDPRKHHYGGSAAAPVFKTILETYAGVEDSFVQPEYPAVVVKDAEPESWLDLVMPPEAIAAAEQIAGTPLPQGGLPDVRERSKRLAILMLGDRTVTVEGVGRVLRQSPPPGTRDVDSVHLICGTR